MAGRHAATRDPATLTVATRVQRRAVGRWDGLGFSVAWHSDMECEVAVRKVGRMVNDCELSYRMQREIAILQALRHENVRERGGPGGGGAAAARTCAGLLSMPT